MIIRPYILLMISLVLFNSCGNDDDNPNLLVNFYNGAQTSASANDLEGIWSIFNVSFNNNIAEVPENYQSCGRDYFRFANSGLYSEYFFQSSDCEYEVNTLNWELNNGVITLSNQFNQFDEWVITELSPNELIFKARFDVDEDGSLDILTFYAQRYEPIEIDMVSDTFTRNTAEDYQSLISYVWQTYQGSETL